MADKPQPTRPDPGRRENEKPVPKPKPTPTLPDPGRYEKWGTGSR